MPYKRIYTQTHRQWILLHCTRLSSRTVVWQSALALSILLFKSKSVMASPKVSVFALRRNELQWWILNFSMFHTPLYMYYMCVLSHLSIYRHITHTYTFAVSLVFVQIHNSQNCMKNKFAMVWGYKIEEWRRLLIGTLYQPFVMERNSYAIRMKMIYIHWAESFRCINCVCVCVRACVIYVRGAHCAIAVLWSQLSWMYRTKKKKLKSKKLLPQFL